MIRTRRANDSRPRCTSGWRAVTSRRRPPPQVGCSRSARTGARRHTRSRSPRGWSATRALLPPKPRCRGRTTSRHRATSLSSRSRPRWPATSMQRSNPFLQQGMRPLRDVLEHESFRAHAVMEPLPRPTPWLADETALASEKAWAKLVRAEVAAWQGRTCGCACRRASRSRDPAAGRRAVSLAARARVSDGRRSGVGDRDAPGSR